MSIVIAGYDSPHKAMSPTVAVTTERSNMKQTTASAEQLAARPNFRGDRSEGTCAKISKPAATTTDSNASMFKEENNGTSKTVQKKKVKVRRMPPDRRVRLVSFSDVVSGDFKANASAEREFQNADLSARGGGNAIIESMSAR